MIHHMHAPVSNMNAFMLAKAIPNESAHNYPSEKSVNEEKFQNFKIPNAILNHTVKNRK